MPEFNKLPELISNSKELSHLYDKAIAKRFTNTAKCFSYLSFSSYYCNLTPMGLREQMQPRFHVAIILGTCSWKKLKTADQQL
ncbi:hypothetical protein TorRG33x02_190880 [Trema orientale]|uniref:Uncharacterized protein n=1 Tax=Trema orientale TaxID=63057 RepID=A0A2P5EHY6_TREOI|nr:hypothetical protein TorRG33x02_190880 [Trema orientale]